MYPIFPYLKVFACALTRTFTHAILELYTLMLKKFAVVSIWFALTPTLLILSVALLTSHSTKTVQAQKYPIINLSQSTEQNILEGQVLGIKIDDFRPYAVAKFLKGTPLEPHSQLIVEVSDRYDIDYRLIPAIAMKESGGGAAIAPASHNAWGFENGRTYFDSWESAINIVGKTLKTRYIDKGLTTPDKMMAVYAPPAIAAGGGWARDINFFFTQMETL